MAQARSDGLQLLRAINATQAHDQAGARVDPTRVAHEAGLNLGDAGSDRYHHALGYLLEEGALLERVMDPRREYWLPDGGRGKRRRRSATPPKRWVASRNPSPTA
jgi:hypothetical protein